MYEYRQATLKQAYCCSVSERQRWSLRSECTGVPERKCIASPHEEKQNREPRQDSLKKTEALWHNRMVHGHREDIDRRMKGRTYANAANSHGERTKCDTYLKRKETKQPHTGNVIGGCSNLTVHTVVCRPVIIQKYGRKR